MKALILAIALASPLALALLAADQATLDRGQKEEAAGCTPCHSLRLVHSQRLSKATWSKELDKMAGWGSKVQDRDALLEYLAANYGDDKPASRPVMSKDGAPKKQ
jgi:cytochrome c1